MNVIIQFKKGVLELCVLVLIRKKDQYGYELAQQLSNYIEVAEGALYPLLRRLVKEGYCETYLQESNEGPPRKYYRLTQLGAAYLSLMVAEWKQFVTGINHLLEDGK
ncbi:PadR family transcriptional regulator [Paenibacillus albiflavus]|uniref:PadR family transcriptional regulator n=1 Tax=Paenibacillus albiflavus TaxID=2545760 RepID=A0A4R4EBS4_9BACL|nr:PadR family transcriptional regulator [Paenibacillus albiflavus]TCZ76583.1 PadR family transcriptional regulator [Paenibacillus albiflavus]